MPIIGWILVAWFGGILVADVVPGKLPARQSGDDIYQYKTVHGQKSIVKYKAFGYTTCRPQCYMSGSFKDGVLRGLVPYPFRRGKYFECPKEGDIDYCTGETFEHGKWASLGQGKYPYFEDYKND